MDEAGGEGAGTRPHPPPPRAPAHLAPAAAPWPRPGSLVVPPGCTGVPHPPPVARMGQHRVCPCPPRGAAPRGPPPPGPHSRGLEQVVALRSSPVDKRVWITAVQRPGAPEFRTKGATVGQAVRWRYPRSSARAPWTDRRSRRLPYTWRWYLAPMWHEETDVELWRLTRHGRVERWEDVPPCELHRPLRRLTLFEREMAAGRPHTVGVDWWGRVWDNDPARQPPPPTLGLR